jgi:hypothetical protein
MLWIRAIVQGGSLAYAFFLGCVLPLPLIDSARIHVVTLPSGLGVR